MQPQVSGELGVECAGEPARLTDQHGGSIHPSQYLHPGPGLEQPRRPDEDTLHAREVRMRVGIRRRDERIELRSVGIALGHDVDEPECPDRLIERLP